MTRIHVGLLFLFAISLALLSASASVPVMAQGGIAELPGASSDSGLSASTYALIAALAAAALLTLSGGAWYARRRWLG